MNHHVRRRRDTFIAMKGFRLEYAEDFPAASEEAESAQVEATASLGEAVRRGMIARRVLKSIMKLKYKTNPARMAAWQSASRIERDNKKEEETPAPTP